MANETTEPRALSAALSAPSPFTPRVGGSAMHAANRHVERWAPEGSAGSTTSSRPLRSLGFVDRLVAPWIETAQRSASLRMFSHYTIAGAPEHGGTAVSWVFPRPWYQDELDWMAAARRVRTEQIQTDAPAVTMFTTRGTFVAPQQTMAASTALPTALYEYVAPSLSIASTGSSAGAGAPQPAGVGYGGGRDAYSSLVPLAAVQAAELMSRAVAPLLAPRTGQDGAPAPTIGRVSPQLRTVLTAMLERASLATTDTRAAQHAPELVTPPAPRADQPERTQADAESTITTPAIQLAEQYAEQRARIAELQHVARVHAEREVVARREAQVAEQQLVVRAAAQRAAEQHAREIEAQVQAPADPGAQPRTEQAEASRVLAEQLRVEERVAQRIAERAREAEGQARTQQAEAQAQAQVQAPAESGQPRVEQPRAQAPARLHEQARVEAAQHARALELPTAPSTTTGEPAPIVAIAAVAPPEVVAALAALPPELQQMIAARPEGGLAAIAHVAETLRTAELLARSAAANQTFQATRGPRLVMPAGMGGLVSAVERAQIIERPLATAPTGPTAQAATPLFAPRAEAARVPALPWLTGAQPTARVFATPQVSGAIAPTTALGATTLRAPAALTHVAWSDRWLARFAGAAPRSLDILRASAGATPEQRFAALAAAAPESVFVHPLFDVDKGPASMLQVPAFEPTIAAAPRAGAPTAAPGPVFRPSPQPIERFDDNAETPDDVFASIAAAGARARTQAAAQAAPAQTSATAATTATAATAPTAPRMSAADAIASAAPSAPGAGLFASLAASPFAPSLRHVIPMPASPTFDVRALFAAGLSATYLAGLLAPETREIVLSGIAAPAWASFQTAGTQAAARAERMAPELDLSYVAPDADRPPTTTVEGAQAIDEALPSAAVPMAGVSAALPSAQLAAAAAVVTPITTLRTSLLSWAVDPAAPSLGETPSVAPIAQLPVAATSLGAAAAARAMSQSMSLPMLGEPMPAFEAGSSWTAPGMIAGRAHDWSVAQQRSVSDLSFDFVPPELVLAARVYGLGPAEAAQAARLAIAGPSQLSAMASTIDRTFVQAMAIATERRDVQAQLAARSAITGATAITTAFPLSPAVPVPAAPGAAAPGAATPSAAAPSAAAPAGVAARELAAALPSAAFGVERRAPRGAFLWPAATVAALGLSASPSSSDGQQAISVAALELLAAQAVAEIGTYAALSDRPLPMSAEWSSTAPSSESRPGVPGTPSGSGSAAAPFAAPGAPAMPSFAEPAEADVLGAAATLVPTTRRARFDALYLALSQSPSGKSWSPAARAARALALAGRTDDAPVSAYERAATAWDVLPVVYATDGMSIAEIEAAASIGTLPALARAASRAHGLQRPEMSAVSGDVGRIDRPGLAALTSRAGEALGSYVSPSTGELATAASRGEPVVREIIREVPISQRAPSAAAELVRTGQAFARHGGGEVEIPAWFESAARKMFEEKTGAASTSAVDGGFSMAELTLVNAAPAAHVAASSKAPHAGGGHASAGHGAAAGKGGEPIDIDKAATELFAKIMQMMDMQLARNGGSYQ